jgi:hypothetical protein
LAIVGPEGSIFALAKSNAMNMKEMLQAYEKRSPEIVFEWNDAETDARGWVVINSLRGGAAGGGTRMHPRLDKDEVISLAKTMEIKFTVSGPQIGGAKSGIAFDPNDPRKEDVLRRWYAAVTPLLKSYYGTGGDMNVDEIHEGDSHHRRLRNLAPTRRGFQRPFQGQNHGKGEADWSPAARSFTSGRGPGVHSGKFRNIEIPSC